MDKINKYQNFYIDTTLQQLDQQYKIVNAELEDIYKQYSKNHNKLIQELSKVMMEYNVKAEFMDLSKKEQIEINKKMQISIYDMIKEEEKNDNESIKNILGDAIANTYSYQDYVLGLGIDFTSLPLTEEVITKIVNNKIAGEIWSKRLWTNKLDLEIQLKKDIDDFVKGKLSVNKIGENVRSRFGRDYYNSQRLVRSELARVQSEILNQFDEQNGVEYQIFTATLDSRTSETCRDLDGIPYEINDKNKPTIPVHVQCRSALVGIPSKDYKPTTRRDNESGETIPYIDYKAWIKDNGGIYDDAKKEADKEKAKKKRDKLKKDQGKVPKKETVKKDPKKVIPKKVWKDADNIEGVNKFAESLGVPKANYKGVDLKVANEWNRALEESFDKFPELKSNFEFVGTCQERNKVLKLQKFDDTMRRFKALNPNKTEKDLKPSVDKYLNKYVSKVSGSTWAQSSNTEGVRGVTLNNNIKDYDRIIKSLKYNVDTLFHPTGCDTVRSILDHEIGHQLDTLLNLSEEANIKQLYSSLTKKQITEQLSQYSWDNSNASKIREFVAEGWSEYCNNPNPRPIAKEIGETLERKYKEWKK